MAEVTMRQRSALADALNERGQTPQGGISKQVRDAFDAYLSRVYSDASAGGQQAGQGLGDILDYGTSLNNGSLLTGVPRMALGGGAWLGAPVSAALSPLLSQFEPQIRPAMEKLNEYVGQPIERNTGYPADLANELALAAAPFGMGKAIKHSVPYLAKAGDSLAEALDAPRMGDAVYGSGAVPKGLTNDYAHVGSINAPGPNAGEAIDATNSAFRVHPTDSQVAGNMKPGASFSSESNMKKWNAPRVTDAGARIEGPILQRAMHYANSTRNPKKLAAELSNNAGFSLDERAALEKKIVEGRTARASKVRTSGNDPLLVANANRPRKLEALKAENRVTSSPMFQHFSKDRQERALLDARIGDSSWAEAKLATVEAIVRAARKRGWEVQHTSAGKDGRVTSRYIVVPGKGKVRVSDHHLPETAQRSAMREMGMGGKWADEIIVDDWRRTSLDDYMKRLESLESDE